MVSRSANMDFRSTKRKKKKEIIQNYSFIRTKSIQWQALLNITADFATKWNLKFNSDKSKVMVIGKCIDHNKEWPLGSDVLKETNEYKYLGVYFFRSLSFSYHINCYLKEIFEKRYNYYI